MLNNYNIFMISDYRLIKLAQILDSIAEPDTGEIYRPDSNDSMHSALSSCANTGTDGVNIMNPKYFITLK